MSKTTELDFSRADCCRRIFEAVPRQLDLARLLGLTPSAISNTKKRQQCSLELVIAASQITGRPIEWFLFGERGQKGGPAPGAVAPAQQPLQQRIENLELAVRRMEQRIAQLEGGCCSE